MASYVRKDGSESAYEALAWVHVQNDDALGAERAYYRGLENLCVPPVREKVQPGGSRQVRFNGEISESLDFESRKEMRRE
jgi:hypothetical protein